MIRNLGKALTIMAEHEASEEFKHADMSAFGAPSECHQDALRSEPRRRRQARKHAEAVARAPWRVIRREADKRGFNLRHWHELVARIYCKNYPF